MKLQTVQQWNHNETHVTLQYNLCMILIEIRTYGNVRIFVKNWPWLIRVPEEFSATLTDELAS